jgi:hypothetical protein
MQTFLVHADYYQSAACLDPRRLFSQIYESVHILSSLLGVNDKLINPKRSVARHPTSLLWVGHEQSLCDYAFAHYIVWERRHPQDRPTINGLNLEMLSSLVEGTSKCPILHLIPYYRTLLKSKDPEYYCGL